MRLNYRLILITFLIVLIISISSLFIFYALAGQMMTQQQTKTILNATNDYAFEFQKEMQKCDEDFNLLLPRINRINSINLDSTAIDFCFSLVNDSLINAHEFKTKTKSYLNIRSSSFMQFFSDNPSVVLRYAQAPGGKTIFYGILITNIYLSHVAQKIRADVALVINDSPVEISNQEKNQAHLLALINASRELKYKGSYYTYQSEYDNYDFVASSFTPKFIITPGSKINFIVFDMFKEGVEFRTTLRIVMVLIVLAGSILTFIIVWVSTAKLRKQFSLLMEAAELTGKGSLDHKVKIITKDEVGIFGETFNRMLDELAVKDKNEKDYTEFLTLMNQNPTLKEVSEAALSKLIKSTGLTFGVLYIVENKSPRLISSYGVDKNFIELTQDSSLYNNAIDKKEKIEFHFDVNFPEIKTGIATIKIKYLVIYPILYNREVVAILELASESEPHTDILGYIANIHEQLAIGLVNAKSFEQLENYVGELKKLNEDYQRQNEQIINQNDAMKELHKQLSEKADELERQRRTAIELSKVKSDFLASMSHELRTPLISILGLTELLIKDSAISIKTKERLNIVFRNGKKLLGLINNILEFSKLESGKIEVKKESFLLSDLLEDINLTIQQLTSEKNLKYDLVLDGKSNVLINTDRSKLEQILLNLLVNAVKFTENGSIQLAIKVVNNDCIEFAVIDTGIGISENNRKLIFNEFRQVDSSTSRRYGGAGLGLAICFKYCELLDSKLMLQSDEGKGSRFSFVLPSVVLDVMESSQHQFLTVSGIQSTIESKPAALVINDNVDSQRLLGDYLASYGYKIMIADNLDNMLHIAQEKLPAIIILDPFVQENNVWRSILELKQNEITSDIPIVLTMLIEDEKVGWEPEIFEFIVGNVAESKIKNVVAKIENHIGIPVNKIVLISKEETNLEYFKKLIKESYGLILVSEQKNILNKIRKENPQLIIIDINTFMEQSLQISYELSQERATKNIPIILKLPEVFSTEQCRLLNEKLKEITLKVKAHPLDILKLLRDRLKISEGFKERKFNLLEAEPTEDKNITVPSIELNKKLRPTILIVDDDNDALFTVGEYVKELNCDTIFAHNGMECLLTLSHILPDLILLDIMMPQMDGFETIRRIKGEKKYSKIPIIALTAYAMLDNKNVIEKNGFDDIITKPINSQLLATKLKSFLIDSNFDKK
jgi:signal transduction histidine kinase/CheY-like chemotaxis protein/HAMP domain-containing protein